MIAEHEKEVLAMEDARRDALVTLNMTALDRMFSEDIVHVHSNAMAQNKTELLAYIEKKKAFIDIIREDLDVKIIGDAALMSGKITNIMRSPDGVFEMKGWVTQVLRKEAGEWRFLSFQFTKEKP